MATKRHVVLGAGAAKEAGGRTVDDAHGQEIVKVDLPTLSLALDGGQGNGSPQLELAVGWQPGKTQISRRRQTAKGEATMSVLK